MSDLARLDGAEFGAFLEVIGAALAEHSVDGVRTAVLPGTTIRLRSSSNDERTRVITPHGVLVVPNDALEIDIAGGARARAEAS